MMPVYNDWESCAALVQELDEIVTQANVDVEILILDDGSSESPPDSLRIETKQIAVVNVLHLKRNLGHQRAICIGLAYADAHWNGDFIVIMDGDGQDRASDVPALIAASQADARQPIVFGARHRRAETWVFQVCYAAYRLLHRLLTGYHVRVGNFSVLPRCFLPSLTLVPELWSHYAAAVFKSKLPRAQVAVSRRARTAGTSRMDFVSLVTHGLAAMSVFGEIVGVRLLLFSMALFTFAVTGSVVAIAIPSSTGVMVPDWTTFALAMFLLLTVQSLALMVVFIFVILSARDRSSFLPARDYHYFVNEVKPWPPVQE